MAFRNVTMLCLAALITSGVTAKPAKGPGDLSARQLAACKTLDAKFARTGKVLKIYRAFKGADGQSKIEIIDVKGQDGAYYGGKVTLTQYGFGDPTNVVIVYGHANMEIPVHPSPYREIFLIVSGSSTVMMPDGKKYELTPGSMFLSEDQDTPGRGGKSGPCGYVAIDFQYKTAK